MDKGSRKYASRSLAALLGILLATTAWADEQLSRLLQQGDVDVAWTRARSLEAERAGDPDFDWLYGMAAVRSGHPQYAVYAFERILMLRPDDARVRLELARALFLNGALTESRQAFNQVLDTNPPPAVQANIRRFLERIDQQESGLRDHWSALLELRAGHDSNVNSATTDAQVQIPALGVVTLSDTSQETSDRFLQKNALLNWRHAITRRHEWNTSLVYRDRENIRTQASDLRSVGVSTGPGLPLGGGMLRLPVQYQWLYLANSKYRRLTAVTADWSRVYAAGKQRASLFAQAGTLKFPGQSLRNADLRLLGAGWTLSMPEQAMQLSLNGYLGDEDSQSAVGKHNGKDYHGLQLGLHWNWRPQQQWYASLSGQWAEHDAVDPVFSATREEEFAEARVGWNWLVTPAWLINADVSLVRNDSNIALYEYNRRQVSVGVSYRFE